MAEVDPTIKALRDASSVEDVSRSLGTSAAGSRAKSTPVVAVCGSINQDTIISVDNFVDSAEKVVVNQGVKRLGGKGANQAVASSLANAETCLLGTVGEDDAGDEILSQLRTAGVRVHAVRTSWEHPTGSAFVVSHRGGAPKVYVQRGANQLTDPSDFVDEIARADVVLAQGELLPEATEMIAALANVHGTRLVLNLAPVSVASPTLIDSANPLVIKRHDVWELLRQLELTGGLHRADLAAQVEVLLQYCPALVVTMAHDGCLFVESEIAGGDGIIWHQPAVLVGDENFVDATGTGDAFSGTLAAGIAKGLSLDDAVCLATAAASQAVRSLGATASYVPVEKLGQMLAETDFPKRRRYEG